jgi:hypothetical protein
LIWFDLSSSARYTTFRITSCATFVKLAGQPVNWVLTVVPLVRHRPHVANEPKARRAKTNIEPGTPTEIGFVLDLTDGRQRSEYGQLPFCFDCVAVVPVQARGEGLPLPVGQVRSAVVQESLD